MARIAQGKEVLKQAMELLFSARTARELRQAQAVVLPLKFGFSLEQTAAITGISKRWTTRLRTEFIRSGGIKKDKKGSHGGRRRQNMSYEEEVAFLAPFFEKASQGGILIVGIIKEELDKRLGRNTALASAYNRNPTIHIRRLQTARLRHGRRILQDGLGGGGRNGHRNRDAANLGPGYRDHQ